MELSPPFPPPFTAFDQGYATTFAPDAEFRPDLSVEVTARAFARTGDPFVVFDYSLTNTADAPLNDLYAGLFADFDVGDAAHNRGGFDPATRLVWAYDDTGTSTNYFGVVALTDGPGGAVSGWTLTTDEAASDTSLYRALTTMGTLPEMAQDVRAVVGTGPLNLAPGESAGVRFALVAGASEAEILAHAAAAQALFGVANEGGLSSEKTATLSVYPNPARLHATLRLTLGRPSPTRIAVYDVLGREVAVLHAGPLAAGTHRFTFGKALPAGTYVVRATGAGAPAAQTVAFVR